MGRATVFAITGCPFCVRSKEALKSRDIPFLEINLSSHPDKRSDLLSLSDSLTLPQIFFNEMHIGGSEELLSLIEQWDNEASTKGSPSKRFEKEVKELQDPTDPRLQPSTKDPVKEPTAPPRSEEDNIEIPNVDKPVSVLNITKRFLSTMPIRNLTSSGKTYKNSITGHDFLNYLMKEFNLMKEEGLQFGKYLHERKLVTHVTNNSYGFSATNDQYYRLQQHQTPIILNSYRIWTDRVDPQPLAILSRTSKVLQQVLDRSTEKDGNVNLLLASQDPDYEAFEEEICELQGVSMDEMDLNTKTAFVINLYNLMIKYAQVKVGIPSTNLKRIAFFTKVKVNIGGEIFSFHDLENGILRANALPPYALKKVFSSDDKRLRLIVNKVDPRIHFGLNCGARSCPPVKKFSATDLHEELRIVALAFCEQDVTLDEKSNTLHCSTIFKWYSKDFAPSTYKLPQAILHFLNPKGEKREILERMMKKGSVKVKFMAYDWGSNVSHSKEFEVPKPDQFIFWILRT